MGIFTMTTSQVFAHDNAVFTNLKGSESLLSKISKRTQSLQKLTNTQLLTSYEAALVQWRQSGYQPVGSDYYICLHRELALFPLHLRHESIGVLDEVILCFEKNKLGEWVKLKALSGFDLEALTVAATTLEKNNLTFNLCDYLLPHLSRKQESPFCFSTVKGEVSIKTVLSETNSITQVLVKKGSETLFQQQIKSKHTLRCTLGC